MRVGLFTECYHPIVNGVVASLDALGDALRASGHEAIVVTPEMPGYRDPLARTVARVRSLPLPTRTAYRLTVPYLPRALGDVSIVHAHSPFVTGWLGVRAARRANVPLVFTYHTQLEAYAHYVPFEPHATRIAAKALTRSFARAADVVIVPTLAMEQRLRETGVRTRIEIVPSGIDLAVFAGGRRRDDVRARFGVDARTPMMLTVGRLGREKNHELTFAAFARMRVAGARLVVVGAGPHRAELERLARALGIAARTIFAGEFARAALPDVYASADAFVFSSTSETQGLVLAEALAARTPVVAVDTPATRDVLAGAGVVVAPDAAALAAGIDAALAGHHPGASVGTRVAAGYDGAVLGARVIALYRSLLGERLEREPLLAAR